ncbi:hypothetical protein PYCC9005_003767 [Savitreella phatthalungensis]
MKSNAGRFVNVAMLLLVIGCHVLAATSLEVSPSIVRRDAAPQAQAALDGNGTPSLRSTDARLVRFAHIAAGVNGLRASACKSLGGLSIAASFEGGAVVLDSLKREQIVAFAGFPSSDAMSSVLRDGKEQAVSAESLNIHGMIGNSTLLAAVRASAALADRLSSSDYGLTFVGYGAGGGVASVLAASLNRPVSVVTFGEPPVYDNEAAKVVSLRLGTTYTRVTKTPINPAISNTTDWATAWSRAAILYTASRALSSFAGTAYEINSDGFLVPTAPLPQVTFSLQQSTAAADMLDQAARQAARIGLSSSDKAPCSHCIGMGCLDCASQTPRSDAQNVLQFYSGVRNDTLLKRLSVPLYAPEYSTFGGIRMSRDDIDAFFGLNHALSNSTLTKRDAGAEPQASIIAQAIQDHVAPRSTNLGYLHGR